VHTTSTRPDSAPSRALPPFPTRRSSDLGRRRHEASLGDASTLPRPRARWSPREREEEDQQDPARKEQDRHGKWRDEVADHLQRRSEEHTSELQSRVDLVCRLLLEKKKET